MRNILLLIFLIVCLTGCGGGSGGSTTQSPGGVGDTQSPGGIWFGRDSANESVVLYIAENGRLRATLSPQGSIIPSFGGGSVSVTSNNVVAGSFEVGGDVVPPTGQRGEDLACAVSGTVMERQVLSAGITCSDSAGIVYEEELQLIYDPNVYERDSSLEDFAGQYTLEFQRDTNSLSIEVDGTLFGMFNNGAQCSVEGIAGVIDTAYTLIDVTWTMSACTNQIGNYEGTQMSGFALAMPIPSGRPGSYYFLLTGQSPDGFYSISVLYEPV
ncbi:MAG: hypothetical protein KJP16_01725 [Gammaproteobacteria bacterium]|nr:hypothetical protein [Gammaproteobacteria bacterium]NNL49510.1 hypothetical protein [Woeseiaceae bacterium]